MRTRTSLAKVGWVVLIALSNDPVVGQVQLGEPETRVIDIVTKYRVIPNVTYQTANNWESKLDLYLPRRASEPLPVFIGIHGGGWTGGSKEAQVLHMLPWLEMGWAVVNVEYRLARVSLAPAAVEDCLCALRWVIRRAEDYNFDTNRIVTSGTSAGGHLALTTAMIPASAGLDRQCFGDEKLQVAAVINWFGITDVGDLLEGPNTKNWAVQWLGSLQNRLEIARRVSPLTYVREGLPPILTIHGDADPAVPYEHATRLHEALDAAGVPNQLHTVLGGGHGRFSREEMIRIFDTIRQFLDQHGLLR